MVQEVLLGRAYVRLIEAADAVALHSQVESDRVFAVELAVMYRSKLRKLLAGVSPSISAEILAASEKIAGTPRDVGLN